MSELRQRTKNAEERRRKDEIEEEEEERIEIPVAFALLPKSSGWMADDSDSGGYTTDITSHHNPADSVCEGWSVGIVGSAERIACSFCRRAGQTEEDGVDEAEDTRPFR